MTTRFGLAVAMAMVVGPAYAQDTGTQDLNGPAMDPVMLEARLNALDTCSSLQIDLRQAASWAGVPIPDILPFDSAIGFDKNRHEVSTLTRDNGELRTELTFACEPTGAVSALSYLGVSPESLRLTSDVTCSGPVVADNRVSDLTCEAEGRFGGYLTRYVDLGARVSEAINGRTQPTDGFGASGDAGSGANAETGNAIQDGQGESPFAEDQPANQ